MKKLQFLVLAFSILAIGCKKEAPIDVNGNTGNTSPSSTFRSEITPPTIIDDRFYFATEEAFGEYMHQIVNTDLEVLDATNFSNGFISFTKFVNTEYFEDSPIVDPSKLNNDISLLVEDPFLSSVLNYNLEMQVGDRIYRIEKNYSFSYTKGKFNEVTAFNANSGHYTLPDEGLFEINSNLSVSKHSTVSSNQRLWIFGHGWRVHQQHKEIGLNDDKSLKGTQWETNVFFYRSVGVKTEYLEKRGWWIFTSWQYQNIDYIEVKWNGKMKMTFSGSNVPLYRNVSGTEPLNNASYVAKTLFMEAGGGTTVSGGTVGFPSGTITGVDFDFLDSDHRGTRFLLNYATPKINWIW